MGERVYRYVYILLVDNEVRGVYEEEQAAWDAAPDEGQRVEVEYHIVQ